jgi:hypothetical protein
MYTVAHESLVWCPALFLTVAIPTRPPHLARYARHPLPQGGEGKHQ